MGPSISDTDDPILARLREICLSLPEANEKLSHGRPIFYTKKTFACYGASVKGDHHNPQFEQSVVFRPSSDEHAILIQHPAVFVPAYWGPSGWLGYDLSGNPDWDEVVELVDDSYRNTATKKLIAQMVGDRDPANPQ